jgi:hypothetical protein
VRPRRHYRTKNRELFGRRDLQSVLAAPRRGLEDKDPRKAAAVAVSYVQLVYGRQLQHPADEQQSSDPLDVASMPREKHDALKRRILAQHPHPVSQLRGDIGESGA